MQHFGTLWQFSNLPLFSRKIYHSEGGRGGPQLFFLTGILIFILLRSPCKNSKPYDKPFWDFSNRGKSVISESEECLFLGGSILQPISRLEYGLSQGKGGMQILNCEKKWARELLLNFVFVLVGVKLDFLAGVWDLYKQIRGRVGDVFIVVISYWSSNNLEQNK